MRLTNKEVIECWENNRPATSHTGNLSTNGKELFSYLLQIGDTDVSGAKIVKGYTAKGNYGFRSQTTSCHVGLARQVALEV